MTTDPIADFHHERHSDIAKMGDDKLLRDKSLEWMILADKYKYTYNYSWMGRPIIKYPNDILIQQEIMWEIKPDLVIETGIAHGGSIVFTASMLHMMGIDGHVVGIDIDIRPHNLHEIQNHPMSHLITMYQGSSIDKDIVDRVKDHAKGKRCVMVILDSHHTHDHVFAELCEYAPLVTLGSYCILPDTFIEFFPKGYYSQTRPWDVGDNPYTAMQAYMADNKNFEIDHSRTSKAMITEAIDGYLKRVQ